MLEAQRDPRPWWDIWLASQTYLPSGSLLVYENDRATYATYGKATLALAHEFMARGVVKGDRIAVVMRNLPEFPVAFYAASLVGAIIVPLNAWWTGPELEYGLADSGCKIAVVDSERLERITEHLDQLTALKRIYVTRHTDDVRPSSRPALGRHARRRQ